ncbi:MAG: hypothetical protein PVG22_10720 [Chromatiales bacterium]|jgi:hypothetical protein
MKTLLNHFVDLCLLRKGPQDTPFSTLLLGITGVLNVLVGVVMIVDVRTGVISALGESLFDAGLMLAVLYFALRSQNRRARFVQTATALMGTGLLLGLLALPLISWSRNTDSGEAGLLLLALIIWSMVVMGHILRHTFEIGLGIGIGLAFAYTLLSWNLALILFPVVN